MVQTISDQVNEAHAALDSNASTADLSDNEGEAAASGDAGGGGVRDQDRVAELTKLLCTVHNMSSQASVMFRGLRPTTNLKRDWENVQFASNPWRPTLCSLEISVLRGTSDIEIYQWRNRKPGNSSVPILREKKIVCSLFNV